MTGNNYLFAWQDRVFAAVEEGRISRSAGFTAVRLTAYRNYDTGASIHPGIDRLSRDLGGVSERTVRRDLEDLQAAGLIEQTSRGGGPNGHASTYRLVLSPETNSGHNSGQNSGHNSGHQCPPITKTTKTTKTTNGQEPTRGPKGRSPDGDRLKRPEKSGVRPASGRAMSENEVKELRSVWDEYASFISDYGGHGGEEEVAAGFDALMRAPKKRATGRVLHNPASQLRKILVDTEGHGGDMQLVPLLAGALERNRTTYGAPEGRVCDCDWFDFVPNAFCPNGRDHRPWDDDEWAPLITDDDEEEEAHGTPVR